jgi:hypothetical protein
MTSARVVVSHPSIPVRCSAAGLGRHQDVLHDSQGRCTVHPLFESAFADVTRQDQEVVELPLLLPRWQAVELEAAASRRGMTTGQMLRRVIGELLATQPARNGS